MGAVRPGRRDRGGYLGETDNPVRAVAQHRSAHLVGDDQGGARGHPLGEPGVVELLALIGDAGPAGIPQRPVIRDSGCCHGIPLPGLADLGSDGDHETCWAIAG